MTKSSSNNHSEILTPFAKTPLAKAMHDIFGSEASKILAHHEFKEAKPGVEGITEGALHRYFEICVASNATVPKQAANDGAYRIYG